MITEAEKQLARQLARNADEVGEALTKTGSKSGPPTAVDGVSPNSDPIHYQSIDLQDARKAVDDPIHDAYRGGAGRAAAPKGIKGVAILSPKGKKLGEFDEILPERFIEDKAGATDVITKGLKFSGKTFEDAAKDWASKNIFQKTKVRIENLAKATKTMAEEGGSRVVPQIEDIKGIRELHFRIDGNDPKLIWHVKDQIENLRKQFPDWRFTVEFGR